jgi:hypothetical protein
MNIFFFVYHQYHVAYALSFDSIRFNSITTNTNSCFCSFSKKKRWWNKQTQLSSMVFFLIPAVATLLNIRIAALQLCTSVTALVHMTYVTYYLPTFFTVIFFSKNQIKDDQKILCLQNKILSQNVYCQSL